MALVKFKNENITLEVQPGTKLSECIRIANLSIETPCNCMGLCGKCKVKALGELSEPSLEEKAFIKGEKDIRLACLAKVCGDIEVELLNKNTTLKTINRGYSIEVNVDPEIKKIELNSIKRDSNNPFSEEVGYKVNSTQVLEKIAALERGEFSNAYGVICGKSLIDIQEKFNDVLGVAVDIGTTGISAYFVNLESGEILNKVSCLNPQTEYGGDVLTRITFAINNEDGTEILRHSIVSKINEIVKELVGKSYGIENIYKIIIAANTTMLHLFAGINPSSIAKAPYRAVFLDKLEIKASELNIDINREGTITLLPSASSYVGADILSGIAATDFHKKSKDSVFIDIGTNGEIVAISEGKLVATSTAAGPALEGMNISCGCRAEEGAIDTFNIDENFNINFTTIGDRNPKGICGSGLIDITASLVERNIVLPSGRFNNKLDERISSKLKDKRFYITEDIYLSQKDIRQIQLAKGAIATGVTMLLSEINIVIEDIKEVVIAGAFGYHINPSSIKIIGLIPKGFNGDITFVGNSSVEGARLALINKEVLNTIESFKGNIEVLELSTKEKFQEYFVEALGF
ncbi:ASKHA domain-containing protein [Clostridium sp.]|uniref:ASKHA domain-containing protein n=1 Tax=Clostridium sp. TaxID=1506 RepID=UPI002FCAC869